VPLFVSVTVCAALVVPTVWLPNVNVVGDSVTAGTPTAVPVRAKFVGLFEALLCTMIVPAATPPDIGVKLTVNVADSPAPKVNGTVIPLGTKLLLLLFTCEIVTLELPVLLNTVVVCELCPIATLSNVRAAGVALRVPSTPAGAGYS